MLSNGSGSSRGLFSVGVGLSHLPLYARKLSYPSREYSSRCPPSVLYALLTMISALLVILLFFSYPVFGERKSSVKDQLTTTENINYGIVLDAGSSGTRAYLYYWPRHSGDKHDLLSLHPVLQDGEPMVKKVTPGLSSLESNPDNAFEYLRPLLQFASQNIPSNKHKETPLYILATAGMRLVEKSKQDAILENVRRGIKLNFDFYFPDAHLEIISGKQEGIYQWLAINYVLGKFNHNPNKGSGDELVAIEQGSRDNLVFRPRTVGALDMGGASLQIAMEITSNLQLEGMDEIDKSQIAEINIGCTEHDLEHTYRVFVTTFLGFGANQALNRHNRQLFLDSYIDDPKLGVNSKYRIKDPCRPTGMKDNVTVELDINALEVSEELKKSLTEHQNVFFYGTGDWESCYTLLNNFTKNREGYIHCDKNCPDPEIKVPPIQFDNSEFYGFSEFWYTMEDVLGMGGKYMYNKYRTASKEFCSTRWLTSWARFKQGIYPNSDAERLETQCFKSAWIATVLHQGFSFPHHYGHLSAAPNTVHGEVVHWTLGALLYRTRYLPLRSMGVEGVPKRHALVRGSLYSPYIVWLCLFAVSSFILLYVYRLRRYMKPSTLRNVPSWNVFNNQEEENLLRKDQDYLYSHTQVLVG